MFIANAPQKSFAAPAEPNVAIPRIHCAPLERVAGAGGGYKHLAATRPTHNYSGRYAANHTITPPGRFGLCCRRLMCLISAAGQI